MKIFAAVMLVFGLAGCSVFRYADRRYNSATAQTYCYESPAGPPLTFKETKESWCKETQEYVFKLKPSPEHPEANESAALALEILKKDGEKTVPVTNAIVQGRIHMYKNPGHVDYTPSDSVKVEFSSGLYRMPVVFRSSGDWDSDFSIHTEDGKVLTVSFPLKIKESPYQWIRP